MMAAIRAEFRKLWSVRSTYVIIGIALAIVTFYAFYIEGFRADKASLALPTKLASEVTGALGAVTLIGALVAVLLMANEYRHNTIMYTLTSSNSRNKVLLAKILTVTSFAVLFTVLIGVWSPLMTSLGLHIKGLTLVPQTIPVADLLWRGLSFGVGYGLMALALTVIIRNQIGAIVTLFIVPGTVEALLGLLLKKNVAYLPFTALTNIINDDPSSKLNHSQSLLVFVSYLVIAWIIAWGLFLRRDAN